jgi:hypothetical protein
LKLAWQIDLALDGFARDADDFHRRLRPRDSGQTRDRNDNQ